MNSSAILLQRFVTHALRWLRCVGERSDAAAAVLIALVVFMMVLPLPTLAIDILIAVNISIAVLLIALAVYLPNATAFSSFPVVLLFTTLFRLGIEISTSRSILMHADAGAIVDTFGRFVAGDNVVVGGIVFFIVAVVQFLVITKGAERVAEVAARFSLDSMPGRQMAIDADLRAGLARPETVQYQRGELARESKMHGAMDGAMKFVKGDAIAGFVIVLVNLTAGMAIGVVQNDMAFADALQRYAVLTIGNGLIAQIPALLISIAAAVLITRGSDDGASRDVTVGKEIIGQLRAAPAAWLVAGAVAASFAAVPGMPWPAFLVLAGLMLAFGVYRLRGDASAARGRTLPALGPELPVPDDCDVRQIVPIRPIVVLVSQDTISEPRFADLMRAVRRVRNEIVLRYGVTVPNIDMQGTNRLDGDAYEVAFHEVVVAVGHFHWDCLCVPPGPQPDHGLGDDVQPQSYAPIDYFAQLFAQLLHRHAEQFVGIHEAQLLFGWLQREMPATAKELAQVVPLPRFAEVLRLLVGERVSIRNVRRIVEALVTWAPREKETTMLADQVRLALQAQICQEFSQDGVLHAVLLERDLEDKLRASLQQTHFGWSLALDHETMQATLAQAKTLCARRGENVASAVVLTAQDLRRPLRLLLRDECFDLHVLSFMELTVSQRVRAIGSLSLQACAEQRNGREPATV
ncbi:flagellar biosynthesis protein FlhA [Trinickia sp. LjRoot230]|uniref:FHIPEP family type III secretion protein n=1 Tax=Trinickia sp. LjRoot230 TaxID=3342288 RepID=UPI003ED0DF13